MPPLKIILIATLRLGDTVMISPLLPALRRHYPSAQIEIIVRNGLEPLYLEDPHIQKVHTYQDKKQLFSLLRKGKYQIGINCFEGKFNKLLFFSRIPIRVGLRQKKPFRDAFFLTHSKKPIAAGFKELLTELASLLQIPLPRPQPKIYTTSSSPISGHLIVHPGSLETIRIWPYFSQLIDWLSDRYPHKIFLTGTASEQKELSLLAQNKPNVESLAGQTTLFQLMGLLKTSRLVIGNDTGPIQLAKALGAPTITIYGAAHARTIGFDDPLELVHEVPCRPKNGFLFGIELHKGGRCENYQCQNRICLSELSLERVQQKIIQALPCNVS